MSQPRTLAPLASLAAAALIAGCLSKAAVEPIHYYSPGPPAGASPASASRSKAPAPLWLRRVEAANHLNERMARRTSDVEIGFYDLERWSDPPANLVERALARELFETLGVERADAGRVPRLDVRVLAFEERMVPAHTATVTLAASLMDSRDVSILERTFSADSPVDGSDGAAVARAMGAALEQAVKATSAAVVAAIPAPK